MHTHINTHKYKIITPQMHCNMHTNMHQYKSIQLANIYLTSEADT